MSDKLSLFAVAFSFPPDSGSGSLRNHKLLKCIGQFGWELTVLTHRVEKNEMKQGASLVEEIPATTKVLRAPYVNTHQFLGRVKAAIFPKDKNKPVAQQGETKKRTTNQRITFRDRVSALFSIPDRYVSWLPIAFVKAWFACLRNRPDVIYAVAKPWTGLFVGYLLKRTLFIPLVIDFMDPWNGKSWNSDKNSRIDRFLEWFVCSGADFVIANTENAKDDFVCRVGIDRSKVGVITCGYDAEDFSSTVEPLRSKSDGQPFTITHTGTFYSQRSPGPFLRAIKNLLETERLPSDMIRIQFIGTVNCKDESTVELLADDQIKQVLEIVGWIDHEKVIGKLYDSDLLLLVQPGAKLQIPAKIYEYAASGRPILALADDNGAVSRLMKDNQWGSAVDSDDVQRISSQIESYYSQWCNGGIIGLCHKNVEDFSTDSLAEKLSSYLENTTRKRL